MSREPLVDWVTGVVVGAAVVIAVWAGWARR